MAITTAERTQIIELTVLMFNAAPGATYLSQIVALYEANPGTSAHKLHALANQLATTSAFTSLHPNFETAEEFAAEFLTPLGLQNDAVARDFVIAKFNAGVSKGQIMYEGYVALNAVPSTGAAQYVAANAILNNKTEVAEYYSVTKGGAATDLVTLQATITNVTADAASVTSAKATIDGTAAGGQTFTLTTGADNVVGTAGDDVINAMPLKADGTAGETLTTFDAIDGAAGKDTLNIYTTATENEAMPASVTVKNVEIVNILNTVPASPAAYGDASLFTGVTQLWQHGASVNVTKLASSTIAGFKSQTLATAGDRTVTATATATSVAVALDAVKGDAVTNTAELNLKGDAVTSVTVGGTLAQTSTAATDPAANLALIVTVAKDAATAGVNTGVTTTLTIENDGTSTKDLTTVDASTSTGAITYTTADNKVSTIKTGSGGDTVTISTATSNTVGAVVNALVETGAGKDSITINTTGTGTTTVNAGDGDDTVILTGSINTSTRIDGGAGIDTVKVGGKTFIAEDYVLATNAISNVEKVEFTGLTVASVDASKLSAFGTFTFAGNAGDKVTEASAPALVTKGNLEAYSTGYKADGADADTLTDAYGGALNITQSGTGTIDAFASAVALTVKAGTAAVASTVTGDAQTLNLTLTNGANALKTADTLTSVTVNVMAENTALTSLTLSGNGSATVVGGSKLATIDASGLGGTLAYGATKGNITGGLTFTGDAAVKETVTLGTGADTITVASTFGKLDTISGFDSVRETGTATSTTDVLVFAGVTLNGLATGQATKVTLTANATTLDLAFVEAAAADALGGTVAFFQFGGDTYLFQDQGSESLDAADLAVKVVGVVDFTDDWGVFTPA